MKAIINGKRYDTETAEKVARWSNGASCSDFNYCEETLYRTKSGAFFLYGEGGALSPYSTSCEGGRAKIGGSAIKPLTQEETLAWLEEKNEPEAIERLFPDKVTDA